MKVIAHLALALVLTVSAQSAYAETGEAEIQRIEHGLNQTLSLSRSEQLKAIEAYSAEIVKLIAEKSITPARAELALDFINRIA